MRFAARMIAIMAVAFLMVPALCADETAKPAARAKKDEAVSSRAALGAMAMPAATTAAPLPAEVLDRLSLHVAGPAHRDDDVLLGDEILDVELALVGLELRPARVGEPLLDLEQLLLDERADLLGVSQQGLQVPDPREQLLVLGLELLARELGEAPQRHVQDVVGLDLAELELLHQLGPRLLGVL